MASQQVYQLAAQLHQLCLMSFLCVKLNLSDLQTHMPIIVLLYVAACLGSGRCMVQMHGADAWCRCMVQMHAQQEADLHDSIPFGSSSAAQGHLHMSLVPGIWVVLWPLSQLLGNDVLVHGHQPSFHLLLNLPSKTPSVQEFCFHWNGDLVSRCWLRQASVGH